MNISEFNKILEILIQTKLEKSDAAVWLQGDRYDSAKKILKILKNNWTDKLVISGNNILVEKKTSKDTDNITLIEMKNWIEGNNISPNQIIIENSSFHTADQANNVVALAKKKKWKKIILVTSFYHQPRAFLTFLKSSQDQKWDGKIINQPTQVDWLMIPGGRSKTAKEYVIEEIKKINQYKSHIASFKKGIIYLNNN